MNEFKTYTTLKALTAAQIGDLVSRGEADKIVEHMKAYETQQEAIKDGTLKLTRLTCKTNKADGLYISHPSMAVQMKGGCNFNKHMLPAVRALVTDENLMRTVREYFQEGTQVDTNVIKTFE